MSARMRDVLRTAMCPFAGTSLAEGSYIVVRHTTIDHAEDWKILCSNTEKQCFKTRKKENGELKSAVKALIKGQEKIFIDINAVSFLNLLKSTFSLWPEGFFRLKEIAKVRSSNKEMHENISKKVKKNRFFFNQKLFKNA